MAREVIWGDLLVIFFLNSATFAALTIDRMRLSLSTLLVHFSIPGELLSQDLFLGIPFFNLILTSSPETLVVIENR